MSVEHHHPAIPIQRRAAAPEHIQLKGVHTHNLKGIDVEIPQGKLTVVTGLSGSGKSSLAFDTLYAEGQRRYTESLSTYARQFLQQLERPPVDFVKNIQPAVALRQHNETQNARSTVGTVTEIDDHLHLLFTHIGEVTCVECGHIVQRDTLASALDAVLAMEEGSKLVVEGMNPMELKRGIDAAVDAITGDLAKMSKPTRDAQE
ncbi:MAG: excinuclease ABC subunit A, partial [Myxococcota bacterium]|nr:excinuclease ABC subunit A [Myxococcota bacterium]